MIYLWFYMRFGFVFGIFRVGLVNYSSGDSGNFCDEEIDFVGNSLI